MKQNLLGWLVMVAMTLGTMGCSNDEVVNDCSPENAIRFGTYLGRNAEGRASALDNTGLPAQGFGVFAYYSDGKDYVATDFTPNFMNNTHVTSTDGRTWTYSPVKYWPNEADDKLSFFAYAPYDKDYSVTASSDPAFTFTVDDDVTNQIDLVVANASNNKNLANRGTVNFTFAHVLSKVGFMVEAVIDDKNSQTDGNTPDSDSENTAFKDSYTTVSVQEVELIGAFYNSGTINLNTSVWSTLNAANEKTYLLSSENEDFTNVADGVTTSAQQLNSASEYMMLIPTNDEISVKIRVKYTVTTSDDNLADKKSVVVNEITSSAFNFKFEQGKAYNFVLHLGLTSVKLAATVSDWDTPADVVVNVPINN